MKIFCTSQIRRLDQLTIEKESISAKELMERASMEFVKAFIREVPSFKRIFIFAGPGSNGGDALVIARLLTAKNYSVQCFLLNSKDKLSTEFQSKEFIKKEDIIIDGLFGSGLNKPLEGIYADLVNYLNDTQAKIYSIDIPSGLFGENTPMNIPANIIKAYKTFTFQFLKLAFLLPDSGNFTQEWETLDIHLHQESIEKEKTPYYYMEEKDIFSLIRSRNRFDYKNTFGHALVIAGSKGKMGAAVLCAKACLRAGAGLVSAYLPSSGEKIMQTTFPEAMTMADNSEDFITDFPNTSPFSAIGIGPGIGVNTATVNAFRKFLSCNQKSLVLDADALNIISKNKELWQFIPANSILTPHVGEFDRLVGVCDSAFDRLQKARDLSFETNCIIVLKGAYTAICTPEKEVFFNSTGNPGMATAGSGDVLTGIITGLLAQNYSSLDAAKIGVFIHGLAGDIAAEKTTQNSLIASDIVDNLATAFAHCQSLTKSFSSLSF